jgi:hypothetical protein
MNLKWLEENPKLTTEEYKNKQKECEDKIKPLITKLYGAVPPMPPFQTSTSGGTEGGPNVNVNNEDELD